MQRPTRYSWVLACFTLASLHALALALREFALSRMALTHEFTLTRIALTHEFTLNLTSWFVTQKQILKLIAN